MNHIASFRWYGFGSWYNLRLKSGKPWVAEITGIDNSFKFSRKFINGQFDCYEMKSRGKDVFLRFIVKEGRPHEVCEYTGIDYKERYFCVWLDGKETKVSEEFVTQWLKSRLE